MANLEEDLDKPGVAPGGDQHFTSSTRADTPVPVTIQSALLPRRIRCRLLDECMRMWIGMVRLLLLVGLLLPLSISLPAGAADVRMAFGDNLPPYILGSSRISGKQP
jgi:hypothetical protein